MNTNDYTIRQEKKEEQRAVENLVRGTCTARVAASTM